MIAGVLSLSSDDSSGYGFISLWIAWSCIE